jgi:hypothetical protein
MGGMTRLRKISGVKLGTGTRSDGAQLRRIIWGEPPNPLTTGHGDSFSYDLSPVEISVHPGFTPDDPGPDQE